MLAQGEGQANVVHACLHVSEVEFRTAGSGGKLGTLAASWCLLMIAKCSNVFPSSSTHRTTFESVSQKKSKVVR